MAFSPRNIIGCFLKRGLQRGGHGHPRTPPRYAHELLPSCSLASLFRRISCQGGTSLQCHIQIRFTQDWTSNNNWKIQHKDQQQNLRQTSQHIQLCKLSTKHLLPLKDLVRSSTIFSFVSSAPANLERRNNIRRTWAFEKAFRPRWTTSFLVAQTRAEALSNALLKEDKAYGDLVRANYYDHYWNQTRKIQMGFEWAITY